MLVFVDFLKQTISATTSVIWVSITETTLEAKAYKPYLKDFLWKEKPEHQVW